MNIHLTTFIGIFIVLILFIVYFCITEKKIKRLKESVEGYCFGMDFLTNLANAEKDRAVLAESMNRSYAAFFGRDPLFYHRVARRNESRTEPMVAVDLDGVILKYDGQWKGPLNFDEPIPGVTEGLQKIRDMGFKITVYTTRVNPFAIGNQGFTAIEQMSMVKGVLDAWHIPYDYISLFKPLAAYYIDDRAIRFTDWTQTIKDITEIERTGTLSHTDEIRALKKDLEVACEAAHVGRSKLGGRTTQARKRLAKAREPKHEVNS